MEPMHVPVVTEKGPFLDSMQAMVGLIYWLVCGVQCQDTLFLESMQAPTRLV